MRSLNSQSAAPVSTRIATSSWASETVSTVVVASARPSASRLSCWRGVAGLLLAAAVVLAERAVWVAVLVLGWLVARLTVAAPVVLGAGVAVAVAGSAAPAGPAWLAMTSRVSKLSLAAQ